MGLGNTVKVNIGEYMKLLDHAGFKDDVAKLGEALATYGITETATFYQGPAVGDGSVLLAYQLENGKEGYLKFRDKDRYASPSVQDTITEQTGPNVSLRAVSFLIAGLFGEAELSSKFDKYDAPVFTMLSSAARCYIIGEQPICSQPDFARAASAVAGAKRGSDAVREADRRVEEERQIADVKQKGDHVWKKAAKLIELAKEQDKGPGGIDPDDLTEIYEAGRRQLPQRGLTSLDDATKYYTVGIEAFKKMLSIYSGYKTVGERSVDIGCMMEENRWSDSSSCGSDGSKSTSYYSVDVACPDIEIKFRPVYESNEGSCCSKDKNPMK